MSTVAANDSALYRMVANSNLQIYNNSADTSPEPLDLTIQIQTVQSNSVNPVKPDLESANSVKQDPESIDYTPQIYEDTLKQRLEFQNSENATVESGNVTLESVNLDTESVDFSPQIYEDTRAPLSEQDSGRGVEIHYEEVKIINIKKTEKMSHK